MSSDEGFLQPFEDFLVDRTGTSRDWARCNALFALSVAVGNTVKLSTKMGPSQLNLYFLAIGPSGIAIKTVPMDDYMTPVFQRLELLTRTKFLFTSRFTPEGLHEYLLEGQVQEKEGLYSVTNSGGVVKDEFSRFITDVKRKRYMSGMMEFLNELYNGSIKSDYTKESGYQRRLDVFCSLIAASTPNVFKLLNVDFFTMGLGNRFIYVYVVPEKVKKLEYGYFLPDFEDKYRKGIVKFATRLKEYSENCEKRILFFMKDASDLLRSYEYKQKLEALNSYHKDFLDIIPPYKNRLPMKAFKIAALKAIDRKGGRPWKSDKDEVVDVMLEDAKYAVEFVDRCFGHFQTLVNVIWKEVKGRKLVEYRRHEPNELLELIKKAYDKRTKKHGIINQTALRRRAYSRGFSPRKFNQCIQILLGSEEIKEFDRKTRTKPSHFYQVVGKKKRKKRKTD